VAELVRKAQAEMLEVHSAPAYCPLRGDATPDSESVRHTLIRQTRLLLDTLIAQERT